MVDGWFTSELLASGLDTNLSGFFFLLMRATVRALDRFSGGLFKNEKVCQIDPRSGAKCSHTFPESKNAMVSPKSENYFLSVPRTHIFGLLT